jgi:hypothetical protein
MEIPSQELVAAVKQAMEDFKPKLAIIKADIAFKAAYYRRTVEAEYQPSLAPNFSS